MRGPVFLYITPIQTCNINAVFHLSDRGIGNFPTKQNRNELRKNGKYPTKKRKLFPMKKKLISNIFQEKFLTRLSNAERKFFPKHIGNNFH